MKVTVTVLLEPPSPVVLLGVIVDTSSKRGMALRSLPSVVVDATAEEID